MITIKENLHYVGVNDRVKHRFEGLWFLPEGVSYNAYLIVDEKVALIDTVDVGFCPELLENIRAVIGGRPIDYIIVNHVEPDHSGSLSLMRQFYPDVRIVGNKKTFDMLSGYYGITPESGICVAEGDTLALGRRTLTFHLAPMLHWPETMVTHVADEGILFSGDAFGCFGALNGAVVDRNMDCTRFWPEMERYYAAILGKFGAPVRTALKKLGGLDIRIICPTHGPVWTDNVARAISTYHRMASGITEEGLVICYGSMYGHTQRVAEAIARGAAEAGERTIIVHNLSVSQPSFVLADIFRYDTLAIGGPTYNGGLFPVVEDLLRRLCGRSVSRHRLGCFGGFTWSSQAVKQILGYNEKMKMELVGEPVEWKQGVSADTLQCARSLGKLLATRA